MTSADRSGHAPTADVSQRTLAQRAAFFAVHKIEEKKASDISTNTLSCVCLKRILK